MRVVVFGAGAVGGFLAARLSRAGHIVVVIGRAATVHAIAQDGLRLEGRTDGTFRLAASTDLRGVDRPDLLFLCVKGPDLAGAAASIARAFPDGVPVVALQNGLGIERQLAQALGAHGWTDAARWLVRGIHSYGLTLLGPGRVRHAGDGEVLLPIAWDSLPPELLQRVAEVLGSAGLLVRRVEAFDRELWRKALVNASVNPVTADHGVENGALLGEPLRGQAEHLLREAQAAAAAEGFVFPDAEADRELWRVVRATAQNRSSMLQDLDRGRRTEIETISGEILAAGARHGLDLPHTRRAIDRIHRREAEGAARAGRAPDA